MAIDQGAVLRKMRALANTVNGIDAAYSSADADDNRIPEALGGGVYALILPGSTVAYVLTSGQHRHTYDVRVQVLTGGGDPGIAAYRGTVMPDRLLEVMLLNVALGGLCNSLVFKSSQGLQAFEYGGYPYSGYELVFEVSEQASATPAVGS